ncbi:hypothetical protein [Longispora albida]|uniref:hypothetical protein n=1 Tax=Longispora albida TaxID=203523 RepID=UPI0006873358|nr:hypothetical protein [Longispora albida]
MGEQAKVNLGQASTPGEVLAAVDALRRRTRSARHAYWLPLLLFGLLIVLAAPLYAESADPALIRAPKHNPALAGLGGDLLEHSGALGWYWLVALIAGYLVSLAWYRWHGSRVGVRTSTRAYVTAGATGILTGLALPMVLRFVLMNWYSSDLVGWIITPLFRAWSLGLFPHVAIAAGLFVLARLERSQGLVVVAICFAAATALVNLYFAATDLGTADVNRFGYLIAAVLPAPVLLIGGVVAYAGSRKKTA